MRILILANTDRGLIRFRKMLLEELISMGNEVYVSTPITIFGEDLKEMGCHILETPVDRRGINPITDCKLLFIYKRYIKEIKPDKIITYTIKPNIYGGIASGELGIYANITGLGTAFQNEGLLKKLVVGLYKIAFRKAETVFFENKGNRDIFIENNIVPAEKTYCLNGAGVDLDEFIYNEYPPDGPVRFLFIGRVMKEKGIDELLYAIKRLKSEHGDVQLDILGGFEDDYKAVITEYSNEGLINYHGYQKDVKPFIKQSHCFVLPSYHEGMANTLLECGAMGRPLITSNIHGCMEAVKDGETGFLCKVKDKDELYLKMKQFTELSYEKKKEMGIASREHVASVFDKKKVVKETIEAIMK